MKLLWDNERMKEQEGKSSQSSNRIYRRMKERFERQVRIEPEEWVSQMDWQGFSGRTILGIDGFSRTGKTKLSKELEAHLREQGLAVLVFHIDDFIVEKKRRYGTGLEEWQEYYFLQWEAEHLAEFFFGQLKSAEQLDLWVYDADQDSQSLQTFSLPAEGVILVEGVFLQRKEWRRFFDCLIYLECPAEQRFLRESENMQADRALLKRRYWKAEAYYEEMLKPAEQADWVLDSSTSKIGDAR